MVLSGDRKPLESGSLKTLIEAQEMLISGEHGDAHLRSGAIDYWHKLAYLTGDGRWLTYASWNDEIGAKIEKKQASFADLEAYMLDKGDIEPNVSGRQEMLENLISRYIG